MLKKLTVDQITDWFTIGKRVSGVEFLGGEHKSVAAAASEDDGPSSEQPPSATNEIHSEKRAGVEYVKRYRQLEAEEVNARDSSWPSCEPVNSALSQHESNPVKCVPVGNYNYPDLPISRYKEQLISLIENNSVVIIRGSTGSGKSTQLPQYVLDYSAQHSTYCNIVVTQPRKIGASSIARWISKQRSWPLGDLVGYQIGLEKVASKDTRLLYVTTGVLLQKVVGAKSLSEFTHLFIDEVHERTEEMDFLLLVIRKLLRTNSRFVKVILMSATINCQEFADYFAIPVRNTLYPAYVFEVEGEPHAVEEYYLDDLKSVLSHIRISSQIVGDPQIRPEMYSVAVALIQWFDKLEMKESGAENPNLEFMSERGSVLVFLPGLAEINYMHELLTDMTHRRLQVYPLHSSVTLEEQNNVFLAPVLGYRKILLSTNIAESSVTVPDVKYVIDFCLTRTLVCDEDTNYQSLRLCWASKSSCNQRRGRAGRVSKGYCYRLVYKDFWTHYISETTMPEMMRCPLETTVLKVKLLDMGEPRALLATALSPPSISDIEHTVLRLKEIGALAIGVHSEETTPYDGELTFLGKVLAQLPVNQHLGKLIVLGHVFGCLDECLIIAAALSLNNFFAVPFRQHLDGYRNKMHFSGNSKSDCIALVDAFKEWQESRKKGKLRHPKDELEWGRSNCIHIKRIREVAELYEELKKRVGKFNMHVDTHPPAMDHEHVYKQRFFLQVVMLELSIQIILLWVNMMKKWLCEELSGNDPKTTVVLKNIPPYGFLYYKQLQSLFRQCGQVKSISYDGTKAFVEFSRNPTERFIVLPAVYLALKMSQLRMQLELNVHSPEDIEGKIEGGGTTTVRGTRVNVDFQKHTVTPVQKFSNTLENLQTISSLDLSINVTEVVEVGHFWGYRIDEKSMNILKSLSAEINHLELTPLSVRPYPDLVCLAPFTDWEDEKYYRAQILYVSGDSAEVFYVDYGNRSKVALDCLREIPSHLQELPFQALEFKVRRMRPSAHSLVCGEQWSRAASQRFISLVNGCALMVKVFSIVHSILHVNILRYSGAMEIVNIRDMLIEECHAELAEDSYESVLSNENLKRLFSKPESNQENEASPVQNSSREEQKCLIEMLLKNCSANRFGAPNCKATLTGPFNPYNVKFSSMTRVSRFRMVLVEKESVNSVVVSDTPENSFQQLLVAASVSVNATGSTMLLRETSLMPHIPGLPALLGMLFAPVIDLRTDENQTRYIGAICGLGWNHTLRTPIFQDHDIELAFDVEIGADDITQINILRRAINKLVSDGPNGLLHFGQERISQLQQAARQKLLSLICKSKPRNVITPKWYDNPYEWNQKSNLVIDQSDPRDAREKDTFLYQLHKLVLLNA
ncbi:ATP-dependent RNA helicase TDRD9 isoform X2 [Sceloporus undulatus]|uniref:ATP-dependent RNA helicase TDRD9 isoform X2 n=1 Tax=Sceloporus undulatus TaxID=8520 RepID=UPI001C4AD720|nr:ATP-dependent RNA helicase TDRD9 isoform X2 [Sceloporus undulatus]